MTLKLIKNTNIKLILSIALMMFSTQFPFANDSVKLSQSQYDQYISQYIAEVNETKKILDENEVTDAQVQQQAFCKRMAAYHSIAEISHHNLQLETARVMLMVANQFLERQQQSLKESGMTENVFCTTKKIKMAENDMKMSENDK